ncbi:MAG: Sensory transduction histidine kinase [Candidatus Falkowbacteria bacterium GW2011_GWA2_39_24]|uniref:histidine kinase n=1 Tax=Candidatus Falkowbacteria bacterium GW2011_GWA2_39_24 TaxID=1618634 RepID=A0A0G0RMH4_9BACT|nr:MAG: Sensory transduction histidine kinase [Candidatus Falkowbacteria bacterium GW2011_GWA2_39_24]
MNIFSNLDFLSVGIAIASTIVLGFSVFLNNTNNITNKTFFVFSILTALWGFFNLMSYRIVNLDLAFLFLKIEVFLGIWHSFMIFQLLYVFPNEEIKFPRWYTTILIPAVVVMSILTLTPFVFSGIATISGEGTILTLKTEAGIAFFGLTTFGLILSGFWILLRKTLKTSNQDKRKFLLLLIGVVITFSSILSFNFVLPALFNNSKFVPFGAVFTFPFVILTFYAILRHKLFNIRVMGTAILVFLLSVITFSEVIFAQNLGLIIYRSLIFIFVLIFGILLISGSVREVKQREKLAILNDKLQIAYREVDKLSKAKSEFISIASHQIRTPLTAIKGYASMILENSYGKLDDKIRMPLTNVYKSNERLISLVNDLLSISRIESGKIKLEPTESSIEEIIMEVINDLKITAEKKKLYLRFKKSKKLLSKMMLDKNKMRQVILNLIDNSIKYTQEGGIIIDTKIVNSKLQILIKDTGGGMSKEDLAKLFESFSRGITGSQSYTEGTGLGLYIAKKFVEIHNGKIWAESDGIGKGANFFIELPIN